VILDIEPQSKQFGEFVPAPWETRKKYTQLTVAVSKRFRSSASLESGIQEVRVAMRDPENTPDFRATF
jgi:hypothetical protein